MSEVGDRRSALSAALGLRLEAVGKGKGEGKRQKKSEVGDRKSEVGCQRAEGGGKTEGRGKMDDRCAWRWDGRACSSTGSADWRIILSVD
jgi:hypothetical protein